MSESEYRDAINKLKKQPINVMSLDQMNACKGKTIASIGHPAGLVHRFRISFTDGTGITFEILDLPHNPHTEDRRYLEVTEDTVTKEKP